MALIAVLAGCGGSADVPDERGLWENVDDEEPDLSELRRADLAMTSSVVEINGSTFTVVGSLVSLDRSFVSGPVVTAALSDGVALDPVPEECTSEGADRFECRFVEALEINASPPTEPFEFRLSLLVADGVADPSVMLTVSSASNPVANDPDPSNNVVTLLLTDSAAPTGDS